MRLSDNGLAFIAAWEEFQAFPYKATKNETYYTWGFGHYGPDVPATGSITRDQALALLRKDVAKAEASVTRWAHPSINQAQFDALVDHVINGGDASIVKDNVPADFDDMVRGGNWPEVRRRLLEFNKQRNPYTKKLEPLLGLTRRTVARQALFDGKTAAEAEAIGRAVKSV